MVGSGTNPTSIASGAITFTQTGTTITASAAFFTAAMVGAIIKYGTGSGGLEQYITVYTNSTTVTVATSNTQTAIVGTVWMVQQTTLQTQLYSTNVYQTSAGSNGTTFASNAITFTRTFVFNAQASSYTVNEIGYASSNTTAIVGRIVLSSSDVIAPTYVYIVTIAITFTYLPGSPTAVLNVGTNINTAGTVMIEFWDLYAVATNGTIYAYLVGTGFLDGGVVGSQVTIGFPTVGYAQNASIATVAKASPTSFAALTGTSINWVYTASSIGVSTATYAINTTSAGQTVYGLQVAVSGYQVFDILFTAPQTLPNGAFQGSVVFQRIYSRTLTN